MSSNLSNRNAFGVLESQLSGLLTNKIVLKAKVITETYSCEIDAHVLSKGLVQISKMVGTLKQIQFDPQNEDTAYILQEFQYRWKEIERITKKVRKKRPQPILTPEDVYLASQIKKTMNEIFGVNALPSDDTVIFLLEAAKQ